MQSTRKPRGLDQVVAALDDVAVARGERAYDVFLSYRVFSEGGASQPLPTRHTRSQFSYHPPRAVTVPWSTAESEGVPEESLPSEPP